MNKKLFLSLVAICLLINSALNAQSTTATNVAIIPPQYIGYSGFPAVTAKPLDIKNNYAAQDINFFTNLTGINGSSVQRMVIKNTTGFVGIGTGFTTVTPPQSYLHLDDGIVGRMFQITNTSTGNAANDGFLILNLANSILFSHQESGFWAFGAGDAPTGNNAIRMTIQGQTGATLGFIGIGTSFTAPLHLLDVRNGDINTGNGTAASPQGYMIGSNYVLWHNGNIANINVGVGAGLTNTAANGTFVGNDAGRNNTITGTNATFIGKNAGRNNTGPDNTFIGLNSGQVTTGNADVFIGNNAGLSNTSGSTNVFVGTNAGTANTIASFNTFMGFNAGLSNTTASFNTFIGYKAGESNITSTDNVFVGFQAGMNTNGAGLVAHANTAIGTNAGRDNTTGAFNSFVGDESGLFNTTGDNNVCFGFQTGAFNFTGNNNTYIGEASGPAAAFPNLSNAAGIGFNTITRADNKMILGDNFVNVGIGLSDDISQNGPQNKLEINAGTGAGGFAKSLPGSPGVSGLRFRDLHEASATTTNLGAGVLAVDFNGDVIYVPTSGITGIGNYCGATPTNPLLGDYEIPLAGFKYYFTGNGLPDISSVAIGLPCTNILRAKFNVYQNAGAAIVTPIIPVGGTIAGSFQNTDVNSISLPTGTFRAVLGVTNGMQPIGAATNVFNIGGDFRGQNGNVNIAVRGRCSGMAQYDNVSIGGEFFSSGPTNFNFGVKGTAFGGINNYSVHGSAPIATLTSYAGFFNGRSFVSTVLFPSDEVIKNNVMPIANALHMIDSLNPISFSFDTAIANGVGLYLPGEKQYGFKAQDVENVLPELVLITTKPAEHDTLGNEIKPLYTFKSLNYNAFIGILAKGIQELDAKVSTPPIVPTLISPANGTVGNFNQGATLVWNSVPGSLIFYHLQASKDNTFATTSINASGLTDTSAIFVVNDTGTYYWRVNAKNNAGVSLWSQVWSFTDTSSSTPKGGKTFPQSTLSDSGLKQNIVTLTGSLDKVKQLRGVNYNWITSALPLAGNDTSLQIGMIAQEVQNVYPEVIYLEDSLLHIDYQHLVPSLVEAVKELASKDSLKELQMQTMQTQINELTEMINSCCSSQSMLQSTNSNNSIAQQDVNLKDGQAIVLEQNVPNPFAEQTTINYFLPDNVVKAQILFYNAQGKLIQSVDLNEKGKGSLNVFASDLSNGIYTYTLIVDGKIVETKKMVKQQ